MLVPADALPLAAERAGESQWRQAEAQHRRGVPEFDKAEIGREASPPYDHSGTVAMASAWLAFYLIAGIHHFVASGN